jgi:hypothetical protein
MSELIRGENGSRFMVFHEVTRCNVVNWYQLLEGTFIFHHHDLKMESASFFFFGTLLHISQIMGVTFLKSETSILTAVYHNGKAVDSYSKGSPLESRWGHQLS